MMKLRVINKDSCVVGYVEARIGLRTYAGAIVRFTDKTIWCVSRDGIEQRYSRNNHMPAVYRSRVRKSEFIPAAVL